MGNYNYFFFAAHLLDVAVGVAALRIILEAITYNGKQLMLTVFLLTIVVYIYTVVAFNFFRKFYVFEEEGEEADQKCHDMFTVRFHIIIKKNLDFKFVILISYVWNSKSDFLHLFFSALYSISIKALEQAEVLETNLSLQMEIHWKLTESSLTFLSSSSLLSSYSLSSKVNINS